MRSCWLLVVVSRGGSCVTLFAALVVLGRPTGNPDIALRSDTLRTRWASAWGLAHPNPSPRKP